MTYLIESPHTKEECLQALDDVLARGPEFLARFEWGCMSGDHTGVGCRRGRKRNRGPNAWSPSWCEARRASSR